MPLPPGSRRVRVLAVALLVLVSGLAGCMNRGGDAEPEPDPLASAGNASNQTAELPDGRGVSSGNVETNRTEQGVAGVEHKHDYWNGAEKVDVFSGDVTLSVLPVFPDGEGTTPKGVGYIKLPNGSLVYEGAEKVSVLVKTPTVRGQANPAISGVVMQYRSAADADWRERSTLTFDAPFDIDVDPQMTDMPHSTSSLWVFRFTADNAEFTSINVTITAFKGREVVDWPGHPDFYADKAYRVVMDADVTSVLQGFPDNVFYEGNDWEVPPLLISYGTKRVEVFANVSAIRSTRPTAQEPVAVYLAMHNATQVGFETDIFNYYADVRGEDNLQSYHFVLPVTDEGMDAPYQPASRWGFALHVGWGQGPTQELPLPFAGGCGDCTSYEVDWRITVIAYPDEAAVYSEPL